MMLTSSGESTVAEMMFSNMQLYFVGDEAIEANDERCEVTDVEVDAHFDGSNDEIHVPIAMDDVHAACGLELDVGVDNGFDGDIWLERRWCH